MRNAANWAIFSFLSGLWGGHGPPLEPPMKGGAHQRRQNIQTISMQNQLYLGKMHGCVNQEVVVLFTAEKTILSIKKKYHQYLWGGSPMEGWPFDLVTPVSMVV